MNDKNKAEFEAAIIKKFGVTPDQMIAEDENKEEATELVGLLFWVWCASREAVMVTLPEPAFEPDAGCGDNSSSIAANDMRRGCRSAIKAAGLKVAP